MSGVLIVAGMADADFAEEVRKTTRGLDIEIVRSLPAGERRTVLLVWSAAQPATPEDVPTLIELWSQGRLVISRRDDTPLPLGLGDLETVPAGAPARETALKLLHAALEPGDAAEAAGLPPASPAEAPSPEPVALARPRRLWPIAAASAVLLLVATGGLTTWLQRAAPPSTERFDTAEAAKVRRDLEDAEAAASRMKEELGARERQRSSEEAEARAAAERARREQLERQRLAIDDRARSAPPAPRPAGSPEPPRPAAAPPPPPAVAAEQPRPITPPAPPSAPPPAAQPSDDTRIADLERKITELTRELAARAAEAPPAATPEGPSWAMWMAGAGGVAFAALCLLLFQRQRRPAVIGVATVPVAKPPVDPAAVGESLFVSYAHHDRLRVDPLVLEIESMGRVVWIDRAGMTGGPGWAGQIARAIKGSRAVVLMASPSAYASDQVVRELYLAMGSKKIIVPIELEPADLPDELAYILAPFQRHALAGDPRTMLMRALDKV